MYGCDGPIWFSLIFQVLCSGSSSPTSTPQGFRLLIKVFWSSSIWYFIINMDGLRIPGISSSSAVDAFTLHEIMTFCTLPISSICSPQSFHLSSGATNLPI
ncbi:hypothetical protein B0H66DRAFT_173636 [Apodospora peruviana]|uniref:Uncharacterized protein n=1 Tax=Apodospora peruviana TaxID=516989 RepID=A0AAE0M6W3_9PEZI|nr:hypothetical protein B0H66DRAFT_173636 [Apodospora peruviana]